MQFYSCVKQQAKNDFLKEVESKVDQPWSYSVNHLADLDTCSVSKVFFQILGQVCKRLDTPEKIFAMSYKGDNFCDFLFPFCLPNPFWKGVYYIRKECAPSGSTFFLYRVDLIFRREKKNLTVASPEGVCMCSPVCPNI